MSDLKSSYFDYLKMPLHVIRQRFKLLEDLEEKRQKEAQKKQKK